MNKSLLFETLSNNSNSLFEQWYDDDSSSNINQQEYYWRDYDEDQFNIEVDELIFEANPEDPEQFKKDHYEKCLKEKAKEWFDNRCSDFLAELEEQLDFVDDSSVRVYRCIRLAEDQIDVFKEKIKESKFLKGFKGLGVFWSFDKNKVSAHWASSTLYNQAACDVVLNAVIPLSSIDLDRTFILNMNSSLGEEEAEIRLIQGEFLYLESISMEDNSDEDIDALVLV